jgi:hypothetical protein
MSTRLTFITSDAILTRGLRGRTWLAGGLLGLVVGIGVYVETPPTYTATSVVELASVAPVIDLSPTAAKPQLFTIDSDVQVVSDAQVVGSVGSITGQPAAQVRRSLTVSARQLTRVLQISYSASNPAVATAGAQEAAVAFLLERDRLVVKPVQAYLADVFARTESPQKSAALTTEDFTSRAQSRVEGWRQRAISAQLQDEGAGSVLERARVRTGGDRGDIEVPLVTGAGLGALLGVCVALLRGQVRRALLVARLRKAAAGLTAVAAS